MTDRVRVAAALLASRMARGRLASPFTAREVYRNDWTGLTEPHVVGEALECLRPVLPAIDRADRQGGEQAQGARRGDAGDRGHRPRERPALLQVPADPLRQAADPAMSTHRAYGLPKPAVTPEFMKDMRTTRINPYGEFPAPLPIPEAAAALAKQDAYTANDTDKADVNRQFHSSGASS